MLPDASSSMTEDMIAGRIREQTLPPINAALDGPAFDSLTHLRPAAVLVPFVWSDHQWHLLFTRRTETLSSHKGQVSFPGGGAEPEDLSPEQTALRETFEEIGLRPDQVQIFGRLVSRPTVTRFIITPVVAKIDWPVRFLLSTDEVSRVFTIPLNWLVDPTHREERLRTIATGYSEKVIYYQPYDGETLWGATARIVVDLLRVLQLLK